MKASKGFTFFEVLAVLLLISIGFAVVVTGFSSKKANLRNADSQLTKDIQGLYIRSIQDSRIYRIRFPEDRKQFYLIEEYQPPMKKPSEDDREKMEKWEELQREIEALPPDERRNRTRLMRGSFKTIKERELPGSIEITKVYRANVNAEDDERPPLFFYPSGEMDQMYLLVTADDELKHTLTTDPLSGKVSVTNREISQEEWKKESSRE